MLKRFAIALKLLLIAACVCADQNPYINLKYDYYNPPVNQIISGAANNFSIAAPAKNQRNCVDYLSAYGVNSSTATVAVLDGTLAAGATIYASILPSTGIVNPWKTWHPLCGSPGNALTVNVINPGAGQTVYLNYESFAESSF